MNKTKLHSQRVNAILIPLTADRINLKTAVSFKAM